MSILKYASFLFCGLLISGCEGVIPEPGEGTTCGNGSLNQFEACDDGNAISGDGCSDTCLIEEGYVCEGSPSECTSNSECSPNCVGAECGPDGCGGSCGECSEGTSCSQTRTCELDEEPDPSDATDESDPTDQSDAADTTDPTDATDESDAADQSDAADTTDPSDATDESDAADQSDAADTTDPTDATDESDAADQSDAADTTDPSDTTDATDATDQSDPTDITDPSDATDPLDDCTGNVNWVGDGYCDATNNILECLFDGGDCCESTCVDGSFSCGTAGFDCQDPDSPEGDPCFEVICDSPSVPFCEGNTAISSASSGECIEGECTYMQTATDCLDETCWDGICMVTTDPCLGQVCELPPEPTCEGNDLITFADLGYCDESGACQYEATSETCGEGFTCASGACVNDDPFGNCGGNEEWLADGYCDDANNNSECGWDAGDCCETTCVSAQYECGQVGYDCLDPAADDSDPCFTVTCDEPPAATCDANEVVSSDSSGTCMDGECEYGETRTPCGDAAICTAGECIDSADPCAGMECADVPVAYCDGDTAISYDESGVCVDGTCSYGEVMTKCDAGTSCIEGECVEDEPFPDCDGNLGWIADGYCDSSNNSDECGWDGGDCCGSTCVSTDLYECGVSGPGYNCIDPGAVENDPCEGVDCSLPPAPVCEGNERVTYAPDGLCDAGQCQFSEAERYDCGESVCTNGTCMDAADPCAGVTCFDPPEPYCEGNVLISYSAQGTCTEGECEFPIEESDCGDTAFCNMGTCESFDNVVMTLTSDTYGTEISWYVADGDGNPMTEEYAIESNSTDEYVYSFAAGHYCVVVTDSYGDGGLSGIVQVDGEIAVQWAANDYTESAEYCFTVGEVDAPADVSNCEPSGGNVGWIGDSYCDSANNIAECDFDGGDCCAATNPSCVDSTSYPCDCDGAGSDTGGGDTGGDGGDTGEPDCEDVGGNSGWNGDGYCDANNNVAECEFDAGDCCESSCVDGPEYSCGEFSPFDCQAPDTRCAEAGGNLDYVGDGWCDADVNNTEACAFDGGDCCESTCDPDAQYDCGSAEYTCDDPLATENAGTDPGSGELTPCAEGLFCGLLTSLDAQTRGCVTEAGDPPDDALLCDDETPCDDPNSVCAPLTETFGACVKLCEPEDNTSSCEAQGLSEDCAGMCFSEETCAGGCSTWSGDGYCDDGTYGIDFNCEAWAWDGGDCESSDLPPCPADLVCFDIQSGNGSGLCVTPDTLPPTNAAVCSDTSPCPDGYWCEAVSATEGACLQWCSVEDGSGGDNGGGDVGGEPCDGLDILITIVPDDYPEETTWNITDADGNLVKSGLAEGGSFCLDSSGCYTFTVYDQVSDGMCCEYGIGSYTVEVDGTVVAEGAEFAESESVEFGSCGGDTQDPGDGGTDPTCEDDTTWADSFGDDCAAYSANPEWCDTAANYPNDEGVDATATCCVCGGSLEVDPNPDTGETTDPDDTGAVTCPEGEFADCDNLCVPDANLDWLEDQWCDDGSWGVNFNCEAFEFDNGACL